MKKINFLIMALLVLALAGALTAANSRVKIDYCKSAVKTAGGIAFLKEDNVSAAVITLGDSGDVTGRVNTFLGDPFTLTVRNVHDLFSDDDGNLYFFCTNYGLKRSKIPFYETIYKCNFKLGSAVKIWSSKRLENYSAAPGGIPYIKNNEIFIPMTNEKTGNVDIVKFSNGTHTTVLENCNNGIEFDTIIYRNGQIFAAKDTLGIFLNGERIHSDPDIIYDAMSYDNGFLNFIDIEKNNIYHYDISEGTFFDEPLSPVFADSSGRLQRLSAYSDGTITAALEDGEHLRVYRYSGEKEDVYSLVHGGVFVRTFLIFTVLSAVAVAILQLLYNLLFVRIRRKDGGARKYQSIAARITAVSTAAGIFCAVIFGILINGTVEGLNSGLQSSIDTNGSHFLSGYIFSECLIEQKNGVPVFDEQSAKSLKQTIESCQAALWENDKIDCSFILFAESNGKIYSIGDQETGTVPAEYVVSLRSLGFIQNSMNTGVNCAFEDKMSSGIRKYTCTNFPVYGKDGEIYSGVLCAVTDVYRTRQTAFVLYLWLLSVIFGLVIMLLIAANIVLHSSLSGLKRLRRAFGEYEKNGSSEVFLVNKTPESSSDEISETGQALRLMTEGSKVHNREIGEGNRKYKRFMAAGILKMLEKSEISKVNFGDSNSQNALIMRFVITKNPEIPRQDMINEINGFLEKTGGVLLNFSPKKADICFTEESEFAKIIEFSSHFEYPSPMIFTYGTVESGSAGSASGAWLIALSEEFRELDKAAKTAENNTVICTQKAAETLEKNGVKLSCELRPKGDHFEIIPAKPEEESGENYETDNNTDSGDPVAGGSLDPVH